MALQIDSQLPSLDGAEWIQEDITEENLRGKLTIVHFWAISCSICKLNFPDLQEMVSRYKRHGAQSVSIHMPRFEMDTEINAVVEAIELMGLTGPCAVDNKYTVRDRFGVVAWPSYFLYDRSGKLRSRATGKTGLRMAENSLARLIDLETDK